MKIIKKGLHPLYDQYSNQENSLMHALLHTVSSSEWILSQFLKQVVGLNFTLRREHFEISSRKIPFALGDEEIEDIESIPDGWIVTENMKFGIILGF